MEAAPGVVGRQLCMPTGECRRRDPLDAPKHGRRRSRVVDAGIVVPSSNVVRHMGAATHAYAIRSALTKIRCNLLRLTAFGFRLTAYGSRPKAGLPQVFPVPGNQALGQVFAVGGI